MSITTHPHYDVAVVGAGPVGSLCAIAYARKGARVVLFEANPGPTKRMAGEWLHPPAVRILQSLGIELNTQPHCSPGRGFVVFPEDKSDPILLPYSNGAYGLSCRHTEIVSALRGVAEKESNIDFITYARVREIEGRNVYFSQDGDVKSVVAERVVGADGRGSVVRRSLGLPIKKKQADCSRMVGITLESATLPMEGYGHLLCGAPGPIFIYRLGEENIQVIIDIPLDYWNPKDRVGFLSDVSTNFLPETLRPAFIKSLREGRFHVAANALNPRVTYGTSEHVIIGDAAGHFHPLTAVGMTLGFMDAFTLAESHEFSDFVSKRFKATTTPEMLAMEIYEVFADYQAEVALVRHVIYKRWRESPSFRDRTMRLLACEAKSSMLFTLEGAGVVFRAIGTEIPRSLDQLAWHRTWGILRALTFRLKWLTQGVWHLSKAKRKQDKKNDRIWDVLARALRVSMSPGKKKVHLVDSDDILSTDASTALNRAGERLVHFQGEQGEWEGEMVWCPMLTAQYVLLHYIMGRPIDSGRRRRILRSFEQNRLSDGAWGMHEHSAPHLFVTALVYVAVRLLGVERGDPLIKSAQKFLHEEKVLNIPSWGKFWLSLLNVYDWKGMNPIVPELWGLPRWIPLHPSNWYCHTRLIYMAMAAIYSYRFQAQENSLIMDLREELFPEGYVNVKFSAGRNRIRRDDLFARPSILLRIGYQFARIIDRFHSKRLRNQCVQDITRRIRWELQTTNHTSISPVSGFLNIFALWLQDPEDIDSRQAFEKLDGWIWEDEELGVRVTGARSSSWDTGFSLQALSMAPEIPSAKYALERGANFLCHQQISESFSGFREAYRTDPLGGWCFPGGWHGWPVSDCTAEAVLGILAADPQAIKDSAIRNAIQFMLRRQNRNGGFGSYEPNRSRVNLEWLNPAEMFGESMTESSYVECTASCLAALNACKIHFPQTITEEVEKAIFSGGSWLRRTQNIDGSWRGVWGIQFIYGTFFGIRGLIAAGASPGDSAIKSACQWLLERQRADGGWGEHHSGCLTGKYVPHEESQIIQTAWALIALLEAGESNWTAITRGIQFLIGTQNADGTWPKQDMAGVFFRTALLEYKLYRQYFPLHALGLYEERRRSRLSVDSSTLLMSNGELSNSHASIDVKASLPKRKTLV